MINAILRFFGGTTIVRTIELKLTRVPNIGEHFDYISPLHDEYNGEVFDIKTFKDDSCEEERIYINIDLF